jgi:hypothetical protein
VQFSDPGQEFPENLDREPEFIGAVLWTFKKSMDATALLFFHQKQSAVFLVAVPNWHYEQIKAKKPVEKLTLHKTVEIF